MLLAGNFRRRNGVQESSPKRRFSQSVDGLKHLSRLIEHARHVLIYSEFNLEQSALIESIMKGANLLAHIHEKSGGSEKVH